MVSPAAQSERSFQEQVIQLAQYQGWMVYHTWSSLHSAPGFPDLVLVRPPQVLFVELKLMKTRLSHHQQLWLEALEGCTLSPQAYVWRPTDWDAIERVLGRAT